MQLGLQYDTSILQEPIVEGVLSSGGTIHVGEIQDATCVFLIVPTKAEHLGVFRAFMNINTRALLGGIKNRRGGPTVTFSYHCSYRLSCVK